MPTKRLVLAQPASDGTNTFPYVDVRPLFFGTFGVTKEGASTSGDFIISPFTAKLEICFYRLVSGARIFLARDYTPQRAVFEAKNRIKSPGFATTDEYKIFDFWDYIWIGTTADLAPTYSVNMNHLRYQIGSENPFEALDINTPIDFYPMIECLKVLLTREGGPDFAGLTVVEDA
jgi:hypothetical protein